MEKSISIEELHEHFKKLSKDELILDVRTENEYKAGHIPGAKNIPVNVLAHHANELKEFKNIYIYCHMGGRVTVAGQILSSLGFTHLNCVDEGGFPDWQALGFECSVQK